MDGKKLIAFASCILWFSLFIYVSAAPTLAQESSHPSPPQIGPSQDGHPPSLRNPSTIKPVYLNEHGHRTMRAQFNPSRIGARQSSDGSVSSTPTTDPRNGRAANELNFQDRVEQMFSGHSFELELAPVDNQLQQQFEAKAVLGRPSGFGAIVSKGIAKAVYRSAAKNTLGDDIIEREALRSGTLRRDLYQR